MTTEMTTEMGVFGWNLIRTGAKAFSQVKFLPRGAHGALKDQLRELAPAQKDIEKGAVVHDHRISLLMDMAERCDASKLFKGTTWPVRFEKREWTGRDQKNRVGYFLEDMSTTIDRLVPRFVKAVFADRFLDDEMKQAVVGSMLQQVMNFGLADLDTLQDLVAQADVIEDNGNGEDDGDSESSLVYSTGPDPETTPAAETPTTE